METAVALHRSFFPKIRIRIEGIGRSSGLPHFLWPSRPSRVLGIRAVAGITKNLKKAYRCGYSSGIPPDSLLFHVSRKLTLEPFPEVKVGNILGAAIFNRSYWFSAIKNRSTREKINEVKVIIPKPREFFHHIFCKLLFQGFFEEWKNLSAL